MIYIIHKIIIINIIAIFCDLKVNPAPITLIPNNVQKDIILVYISDFFFPVNMYNRLFKILPPSNGYIGNKLNIISSRLAYIIVISVKMPKFNLSVINIIIKFVIGPALATIIFFISNKFAFNIFLL
mgnify:FL=1